MKSLRNFISKIKPHFQEGGKYQKFRSTFDAFETFLFVPDKVTASGSHLRDSIDLKRTMSIVVMALMPALIFGMWNVGFENAKAFGIERTLVQNLGFGFLKVFPIIVVSYVTGLGIEFISAQIRGHEVNEGFLVTGMLIPLIMPVTIPLWMVALATAFAVIIAKEIFGGTGMNILNVALTARAFLFFAYPSRMSGDKVWISGLMDKGTSAVDGFTGATPLASLAQNQPFSHLNASDMFFGFIPGSIGETSKVAIIIGAVILLWTGIASWKIIVSGCLGALSLGFLFNIIHANSYMVVPAYYHLIMGGFAFGIVFMATDPVTASQTETGKWIYGFLIGVMAVLVRVLNPAYPEGVMLAILLMNVWAPLIDYFVVESNINRRLKRVKPAPKI
jgi:Na+-transporting NADH:ubiquinone oxidoreductase subunit B